MVIPVQISLLTGTVTVLVFELNWSLGTISYFDNLCRNRWADMDHLFGSLCSELMRCQVTLFFFLIIFLTVITVSQCLLDIHALKQRNNIFPFAAFSWAHPPAQTEQRTHSPELHSDSEGSSNLNSCEALQLASHPEFIAKASHTAQDGCTLLSSWRSFPRKAVWQSVRHDCPEEGDFPHDSSWHFSYFYNSLKNDVNVLTALTPGTDEAWC